MYTVESLKQDLKNAGIRPQDTVVVHSSLRSIGKVEGNGEGVLAAIIGYLSEGLTVLPSCTFDRRSDGDPVFDVLHTPSIIGTLPEIFRKLPGVVRSWHPTHSVCAFGEGAAEFVSGHEKFDTPCAGDSPWGKLIRRRAKLLFIGTGIKCNTFLHGVEEQAGIPGVFTDTAEMLYTVTPDGRKLEVPSRRHIGRHSRFYAKPAAILEAGGALSRGTFGDAELTVLDAAKTSEIITPILLADPGYFTCE